MVAEKAVNTFLTTAIARGKGEAAESYLVYLACHNATTLYELSKAAGAINDALFSNLQE